MTLHTYIGILWIVAALSLFVWAFASAVTYASSHPDRTRIRLLTTLVLVGTALVIGDIARLRFGWRPFGIAPDSNALWLAAYRTCWVGLLLICTRALYWHRFRSWLGRRV